LVLAGGLIWWLRPGSKPVAAQTVSATRQTQNKAETDKVPTSRFV
jgi:hypothetical protein